MYHFPSIFFTATLIAVGYIAKSHVGSLIVDDLYMVGRSIGVPITGSILKFTIVFTSYDLILFLIVTL